MNRVCVQWLSSSEIFFICPQGGPELNSVSIADLVHGLTSLNSNSYSLNLCSNNFQ